VADMFYQVCDQVSLDYYWAEQNAIWRHIDVRALGGKGDEEDWAMEVFPQVGGEMNSQASDNSLNLLGGQGGIVSGSVGVNRFPVSIERSTATWSSVPQSNARR